MPDFVLMQERIIGSLSNYNDDDDDDDDDNFKKQ